MALMLIAQAEGSHPAIAARDYHIIQGRPALKADAMMARYQAAGGSVKWIKLDDTEATAEFSHIQGGTVTISWDMARAKKAGLGGKDMWTKYPRQMLRSRTISEGIRTVFPGVVIGVYTPEEVEDFEQPAPVKPGVVNIEHEKPYLPREEQQKIYNEVLVGLNGAVDVETLGKVWVSHSKTIATFDEDLKSDLTQKKDESKEELIKKASGLIIDVKDEQKEEVK